MSATLLQNGAAIVKPCQIGDHGYIEEYTHISQYVHIGKYCSIANLCTIGAQPHPLDRLTTQSKGKRWTERRPTVIGQDVWIGCNAVIMAGVTIGTGAVIGAGSVVTKDIPPYAIAYGNPAKVKRYRFSAEIIAELLASKWWDLPHEKVEELAAMSIDEALKALRQRVAA